MSDDPLFDRLRALSQMLIQETSYTAELDAASQRIKRLKDRYSWRRRTCGLASKDASLQDPKDEDRDNTGKGTAEDSEPVRDSSALKVLVAKCLLDPALTIPADATNLHKKVGSVVSFSGIYKFHQRHKMQSCSFKSLSPALLFGVTKAYFPLTLLVPLQLAQGESAMQYEEAMHSAGVASLDEILKEMAGGDSPAIEVNEYNMTLGRTKLYITDITRPRLIR